jgi:hypothetical protein
VVTVDNEKRVNCGHVQNVKQGPDFDGQVTLQADFVIKDADLIEKIRPKGDPESGVRDVSCGYTLKLRRRQDGTLEMYDIRGNHVAVVEKGRAGDRIAIGDSAPPEIKKGKEKIMSVKSLIFGRGLKSYVEEASPEDLASLVQDGSILKLESSHHAVDSAHGGNGTVTVVSPPVDAYNSAAHAALDRVIEASKSPTGMGLDAFGRKKDLKGLRKELNNFLSQEEDEPEHQVDGVAKDGIGTLKKDGGKQVQPGGTASDDDDDDDDDDDKGARDAKGVAMLKAAGDDDDDDDRKGHVADDDDDDDDDDVAKDDASLSEIKGERKHLEEGAADEINEAIKVDKKGESVLKALNDSVRSYIKISLPLIASIVAKPRNSRTRHEQIMVDSYNRAVKNINRSNGQAYALLTKTKIPSGIPALATDSSKDASLADLETISKFYEGVPYRVGKQRHDAYLAQKGSK